MSIICSREITDWDKDNAKFEAQLDRVVRALQAEDTGREPSPESRLCIVLCDLRSRFTGYKDPFAALLEKLYRETVL